MSLRSDIQNKQIETQDKIDYNDSYRISENRMGHGGYSVGLKENSCSLLTSADYAQKNDRGHSSLSYSHEATEHSEDLCNNEEGEDYWSSLSSHRLFWKPLQVISGDIENRGDPLMGIRNIFNDNKQECKKEKEEDEYKMEDEKKDEKTGDSPVMDILSKKMMDFSVKDSIITEQIILPYEKQRIYKDGSRYETFKRSICETCSHLMEKTGISIEISTSRYTKQFSFLVKGHTEDVKAVRRELLSKIGLNITEEMIIPKECRKYILGLGGRTIQKILTQTLCKIKIIKSDDECSNKIIITGDFEGVEMAKKQLNEIISEKNNKVVENIIIDKSFHPFLYGYNHEIVKNIMSDTKTKIHFPNPNEPPNQITVIGERNHVDIAVGMLRYIYEEKQKTTSVISIDVKKKFHKFLIGYKGSTLQEILKATNCAIELPNPADSSEIVMIRGPHDSLIKALSYVMKKANSIYVETFDINELQYRFISLRERPRLRALEDKYKYRDNDNDGKVGLRDNVCLHIILTTKSIELQGKKEYVMEAIPVIKELLEYLNVCVYEHIDIPVFYHKHIIGKGGQNITKFHQEYCVDIIVPNENENSEKILLVGQSMENIKKVQSDLLSIYRSLYESVEESILIEKKIVNNIVNYECLNSYIGIYPNMQIKIFNDHEGDKDAGKCCLNSTSFSRTDFMVFKQGGSVTMKFKGPSDEVSSARLLLNKHLKFINSSMSGKEVSREISVPLSIPKESISRYFGCLEVVHSVLTKKKDYKSEGETSRDEDIYVMSGKVECVDLAQEKALLFIRRFSDCMRVILNISCLSSRTKVIEELSERFNVTIKPSCEGNTEKISCDEELEVCEEISIDGSPNDVKTVKKEFISAMKRDKELLYVEEFAIHSYCLPYVVGKGGSIITDLREATKTRIEIRNYQHNQNLEIIEHPDSGDSSGGLHLVWIEGKKGNVLQAKEKIVNIIESLENIKIKTLNIHPRYHKLLIGHRGSRVKSLMEKVNNSVRISFPREYRSAYKSVSEEYPPCSGENDESGSSRHSCDIEEEENYLHEGDDLVVLRGPAEDIDIVYKLLMENVNELKSSITLEEWFPLDTRGSVLGSNGSNLKYIMTVYGVDVQLSNSTSNSGSKGLCVTIRGKPKNAHLALNDIRNSVRANVSIKVEDDRALKILMDKAESHHKKLKQDYSCFLTDDQNNGENYICITGPKNTINDATAYISILINNFPHRDSILVRVPKAYHRFIVGKKGSTLHNLMVETNTEIIVPPSYHIDDEDIKVIGKPEHISKARKSVLGIVEDAKRYGSERLKREGDNKSQDKKIQGNVFYNQNQMH